ncbi:hypothetical protein D1007_02526 [Hordeum vulgare]|nr:hypothetical protein D1007_02526 [Hordeum vulgare]
MGTTSWRQPTPKRRGSGPGPPRDGAPARCGTETDECARQVPDGLLTLLCPDGRHDRPPRRVARYDGHPEQAQQGCTSATLDDATVPGELMYDRGWGIIIVFARPGVILVKVEVNEHTMLQAPPSTPALAARRQSEPLELRDRVGVGNPGPEREVPRVLPEQRLALDVVQGAAAADDGEGDVVVPAVDGDSFNAEANMMQLVFVLRMGFQTPGAHEDVEAVLVEVAAAHRVGAVALVHEPHKKLLGLVERSAVRLTDGKLAREGCRNGCRGHVVASPLEPCHSSIAGEERRLLLHLQGGRTTTKSTSGLDVASPSLRAIGAAATACWGGGSGQPRPAPKRGAGHSRGAAAGRGSGGGALRWDRQLNGRHLFLQSRARWWFFRQREQRMGSRQLEARWPGARQRQHLPLSQLGMGSALNAGLNAWEAKAGRRGALRGRTKCQSSVASTPSSLSAS